MGGAAGILLYPGLYLIIYCYLVSLPSIPTLLSMCVCVCPSSSVVSSLYTSTCTPPCVLLLRASPTRADSTADTSHHVLRHAIATVRSNPNKDDRLAMVLPLDTAGVLGSGVKLRCRTVQYQGEDIEASVGAVPINDNMLVCVHRKTLSNRGRMHTE